MEAELIIKLVIGLIVVLAVLMFFLFLNQDKSKKPSKVGDTYEEDAESDKTGLASLIDILTDKNSTVDKLSKSTDSIIKSYGKINSNFKTYEDIIFALCKHPNANKDIIIKFDKELQRLNPRYKKNINETLAKALNSR